VKEGVKMKRYDFDDTIGYVGAQKDIMVEEPDGEFVEWEEVKDLVRINSGLMYENMEFNSANCRLKVAEGGLQDEIRRLRDERNKLDSQNRRLIKEVCDLREIGEVKSEHANHWAERYKVRIQELMNEADEQQLLIIDQQDEIRRLKSTNMQTYDEYIEHILQALTDHFDEGNGRCHDCNIKHGGFHHLNCDVERCPKCGGQLISCGCFDED